jgi:cell division septum initiation protein DivIVA
MMWSIRELELEKRVKELEAELAAACDREKAAIAAARLEEAEWWYPRTVTYGLGWQDEDGRARIKALGGRVADRPEPANGPPPATKEGART